MASFAAYLAMRSAARSAGRGSHYPGSSPDGDDRNLSDNHLNPLSQVTREEYTAWVRKYLSLGMGDKIIIEDKPFSKGPTYYSVPLFDFFSMSVIEKDVKHLLLTAENNAAEVLLKSEKGMYIYFKDGSFKGPTLPMVYTDMGF